MNRVRLIAILGACAISLGLNGQVALADETPPVTTDKATSDGPSAQDLKNSKTRGIFFKAPGSDMPFQIDKGSEQTSKTAPKAATTSKPGQTATTTHTVSTTGTKTAAPAESKSTSTTATTTTTTKAASTSAAPFKVKLKTKPAAETPSKTTAQTIQTKSVKTSQTKAVPAKTVSAKTSQSKTTTEKTSSAAAAPVKVPATAASGAVSEQGDTVLKAWLNRTGKTPKYKDGDKMEICVNASKDCNLVIYDFDGKGTLTQIFPNDYQKEGNVKAGDTVTIGGEGSNFDFQVSLAEGSTSQQERLFIFAYPNHDEAPVSVAMAKIPSSPFRSAQMSLEQYRKLVNQSKVYFARSVKVTPKKNSAIGAVSSIQTVSNELNDGNNAPNKLELSFSVEK
jgi:hypothetical protein